MCACFFCATIPHPQRCPRRDPQEHPFASLIVLPGRFPSCAHNNPSTQSPDYTQVTSMCFICILPLDRFALLWHNSSLMSRPTARGGFFCSPIFLRDNFPPPAFRIDCAMCMNRLRTATFVLLLANSFVMADNPSDWPRWRGPEDIGSTEVGSYPVQFDENTTR